MTLINIEKVVRASSFPIIRQDGVSSIQPDKQSELRNDLGEQLSSLEIIIDDLRFHFVKAKKTALKQDI